MSPTRIRAGLAPLPGEVAAYTVSGAADAIVHLRAGGIAHLETVLERLRAVEFVDRTVSTLLGSATAWPVSGDATYGTDAHSQA